MHSDHLNTPWRISRPSDNVIVWRWDSDPFGSTAANEDPDADTTPFAYNLRFPGQYHDAESGLSYNYFRDFDPVVGRYTQSDPIGLDGGINTYAYAGLSPVMRIDSSGLESIPFPGGASEGARQGVRVGVLFPQLCVAGVAGVGGYAIGTIVYPHIAIPLGDIIDKMCSGAQEDVGRCDKEWEEAYEACRNYGNSWDPPRGVTGSYTNIHDCARGLVSEACGGNAVDHGRGRSRASGGSGRRP